MTYTVTLNDEDGNDIQTWVCESLGEVRTLVDTLLLTMGSTQQVVISRSE